MPTYIDYKNNGNNRPDRKLMILGGLHYSKVEISVIIFSLKHYYNEQYEFSKITTDVKLG